MRMKITFLIAILLLAGCSKVTKDDIVREIGNQDAVLENMKIDYTANETESSGWQPLVLDTGIRFESYVTEPSDEKKFFIKDLEEPVTLDRVTIRVNSYKVFDDINDIPEYYPEYGEDLLNKIRNGINADKDIDPETGNYYQNKAWNGRDNAFLEYERRRQVLAVEFTIKSESSRDVYIHLNCFSKREGKYIHPGACEIIKFYSPDVEINYNDPDLLFRKFNEFDKEYRFVQFYSLTTAYGVQSYDEFYIDVTKIGDRRDPKYGAYYIKLW